MECRDHVRRFASMRAEDLPREEAGGRVRHCVVRVNHVETEFACDLHNLVRERQQILRFTEEWIRGRQHLMKRQSRLKFAESERRFGADEVNLVTATRERLPQLGRDDAAAADRRVANDTDIHVRIFPVACSSTRHSRSRCGRSSGSRMTNPSAKSTPASTPNCASRLSMSVMKRGDVSLVCTPSAPLARNWLAWQARARRLAS